MICLLFSDESTYERKNKKLHGKFVINWQYKIFYLTLWCLNNIDKMHYANIVKEDGKATEYCLKQLWWSESRVNGWTDFITDSVTKENKD